MRNRFVKMFGLVALCAATATGCGREDACEELEPFYGGTRRGTLIIKAPDYMHRQLVGYPYWPRGRQVSTAANGRRYVSLNMETGVSKVDGFAQQEVSAVVGGQIFRSNDPPGGGG